MRHRHVALVISVLLLGSACGSSLVADVVTDTSTLISDATTQLTNATSYHLVISFSEGPQANFNDDLHMKLPTDATGTVTENGVAVNVLQTGGNQYLQSRDFITEFGGSYDGRLYGDRWVLATPDLVRTPVLDMNQLSILVMSFLKLDFHGKRIDHVPAATASTAELKSTWGNLYIEELPPHRLVKVESAAGFVATAGYSDVNFELFEYGEPVDVAVPTGYADPNDLSTLPPRYDWVGTWKWGTCIFESECGFTGTVQNLGGTYPAAPSTYTFDLYRTPSNQGLLGKCSGTIRNVGMKKTVGIGCLVTSAGFRSFTGTTVWGDANIDNPSYDG